MRRAEPRQVCIWVACSKPVIVKAEIYRASHLKENWVNENNNSNARRHTIKAANVKPIGLGSAKPVQLGRNLFVSLVIATPKGDSDSIMTEDNIQDGKIIFPTNELLAYDIEILDDSADHALNPDSLEIQGKRLEDLGLTSGKNSIVYPPFLLPTFFLRGRRDGSPLKVLHGSCRKLHGKGHDCLAIADEVICTTLKDLEQRPCALFLTGDQVYADDVAGPLINYLTQFGIQLLGWEEQINGIGTKLTEIKVGERQRIIKQYAKFTSGSASNHLMSFGEFVAMYLVAWNVENWPASFPALEDALEDEKRKYSEQTQQLEDARKALPFVRRTLANVPVYMIFDDHEITDDWNITREWCDNVESSKCGRQIIANGLAAYWAFQGWGNDPALLGRERMFTEDISQYLRKKSEQTLASEDADSNDLQMAFQNHLLNTRGWGTFACPSALITIFLDSRTQRSYDDFNGPARLVDQHGLESMVEVALQSGFRKTDPLIIVTPTPIFGFDLIEKLQELLAMASSVYAVDLETWSANRGGFSDLLKIIMQKLSPSHCIFLSGDVHYGFTSTGTFSLYAQEKEGHNEKKRNDPPKTMTITQFNSSALKTTSLGKEVAFGNMLGRIRQLFYSKPSVLKSRNPVRDNYGDTPAQASTPDKKDEPFGPQTMVTRIKSKLNFSKGHLTQVWIASKSFVALSNSRVIPELIVADNNIGLVTIDSATGTISQKLLVRQDNGVQAYEAKVPLHISTSSKEERSVATSFI